MHRVRAAVAACVVATLATACASMARDPEPPSLEGTAWVLAALPGRTLLPDAVATARFEGGRVAGSDGCNRYTQPYKVKSAQIGFGPQGASTRMACPPAVMAQADAYQSALAAARSYRLEGGRLELRSADGAVVATLSAQPQQLAGTTWRAIAINNGQGAVASLVAETTVTLSFGTDGRVGGSGGCNRFTAAYRNDGPRVRIEPVAATRMACATPGVMDQERAYFKALESVATARFEADRLELRAADGALAVSLVRQSAP